jgi:hypothetical protein
MGSGSDSVPSRDRPRTPLSVPPLTPGGDEIDWAARQAMRPYWLLARVIGLAVLIVCSCCFIGWRMEPTRSELDLIAASQPRKPRPWSPEQSTSEAVFGAIQIDKVHAELLPAWVISLQHSPYSTGAWEENRTFEDLRQEAGKDPNLARLLTELRDWATLDPALYGGQIAELFKGWNRYMEAHGAPYYVAFNIASTAQGGRLITRSYRVVSDVRVSVGGELQRTRVVARVDDTNVGELFFGESSGPEEGSIVVADRIVDFALDRLWMLMDPAGDDRLPPMDRSFAPVLRAEAALALSEEAIACLQDSAAVRRSMLDRLDEIARRKRCGSSIEVDALAWNGLSDRGKEIVRRAARKNQKKRCDQLTMADADYLIEASERLSDSSCFQRAIGQLGAWLAHAVAVHEARHSADDRHAAKGERTPPCNECPAGAGPRTRAEISAYLAAMGTQGFGHLSLFQACGLDTHAGDPNTDALAFVLPHVAPLGCTAGPPRDLYSVARSIELRMFGRSDPIDVPADFPTELPFPLHRRQVWEAERSGRGASARSGRLPMRAFL